MKNISFFVSSTFNDMQSERDLIREKIAPELSVIAAKYGYNIDFIDLRWGINTKDMSETEANRKILQTCFDEIQKSRPFFVALLGERYGWIPDSEDVMSAYQSNAIDMSEEDLDKSITELEIECALRSFPFMDRSLFYFRSPIDYGKDDAAKNAYVSQGKEKKKLELLKKRITEKYPTQTFSYTGAWDSQAQRVCKLENLEQSLIENIKIAIENELSKELAPQNAVEESVNVTDSLVDASNVGFAGRVDELSSISDFLRAQNERLLVLSGDSGCGKSSLMCKVTEQSNSDGLCVLPFFTGCHEHALTAEDMVRSTIWRAEKLLNLPQNTDEEVDSKQLLKRYYELINLLSLERNVVLLVDAINQFAATPMEESLAWLNLFALAPSVKIILSTTPNYAKIKQLRAMGAKIVDIDYFDDRDVAEVTQKFFRYNHRQVNDTLVNAVVSKGQGVCRVPVYLMTLLMELNSIGREDFAAIRRREKEKNESAIDAILNYLTDMVINAPLRQDELLAEFLTRAKSKVCDICDLFVCAIALSRRGLSERHVERICHEMGANFEAADFAYFRKLFSVHLVQRENGAWDFNHLLVKQSFVNSFSQEQRSEIVNATVSTLADEDNENPFKKSEYAYYLALADRLNEYVTYFAQMQQDATVQKALHTELITHEKHIEVVDKLLLPVCAETPVVRAFVVEKLSNGELPFALGERLVEKVLNSIYSEEHYSTDNNSLKEIYGAYVALGSAASTAGYYSLAKDYLLMAVSLATKIDADVTALYGKIADCCHKQGHTISARHYQAKCKRALFAIENRTVTDSEQLLNILAEELQRKTEAIANSKKTTLAIIREMQQVLHNDTLPLQTQVKWSVKLLKLSANAGVSHTEVETNLQICQHYADSAEDCLQKADTLYAIALILSKDKREAANATADEAYKCIKRVLNVSVDSNALRLLADIAELKTYFARQEGSDCTQFERERLDSLAQLNSIAPSYDTLRQYINETSGRDQVRRDAVKLYRNMSRGQKTTEQKSADKIILAIVIGVFLIYFVAMPLMFSMFSGYINMLMSNNKKNPFEMFVDVYLDFLFESIFNVLVCFFAYGLLQLLKPKTDYAVRKRWAIRCGALLPSAVIWVVIFYCLSKYFSTRVLNFIVVDASVLTEMALTSCGLLLVMMVLNEVILLLSRDRRIFPASNNYRRFVVEYPFRVTEFVIELVFVALVGALYGLTASQFISSGKVGWTSTKFMLALPITYFIVAISVVTLLVITRFVRLTILRSALKNNKRKQQTKEQEL